MKMTQEAYAMIKENMLDNKELILNHKQWLIEKANYKNLNTRLGWDAYHGIVKTATKELIRHQDLNDAHITTALTKALKELELV